MAGTYKDVIDLLKKKGATIEDEAADAAQEKFGELVLASSDEVVGEDQVVIKKVDLRNFKEFQTDMINYKNKAHKADTRVKELEDALEAGDPTHARELKKYRTENARLKPLVERFMERQKKIWEGAKEKIPDTLKPYYTFREEGKDELTEDQIMANTGKLLEHEAIGALELGAEKGERTGSATSTARTSATGKTSRQGEEDKWRTYGTAEKKMEEGYGKTEGKGFEDDSRKTEDEK